MVMTVNSIDASPAGRLTWRQGAVALAVVVVGMTLLFFTTAYSLYEIWMISDTYAHGFLIAPISAWLVWDKREGLVGSSPEPTLLPLFLMAPVVVLWLVSTMTDVMVVQQYSFVTMLILGIWAVVGNAVARYLAFPLGFLLLAVPVGGGLLYPMMEFTADFTVGALRLTGIPVYRDGTFFSIPSGDWSVVEACSGLRYLLASITLGVLYAYLTYQKLYKRLLFTVFSILVPVLANGMRAYMIVMIAHLSDMKLATGIDHFIYGWVFFGIVITIMFAIGAIWRDPPADPADVHWKTPVGEPRKLVLVSAVALVICAAASAGAWATRPPDSVAPLKLSLPTTFGRWDRYAGNFWDWRPEVLGTDGSLFWFYRSEDMPVSVYIGAYRHQRPGAEPASAVNQIQVQEHPVWADKEITTRRIRLGEGEDELDVNQHRLSSVRGEKLLVWQWYRIGDIDTADPLSGKLAELVNRLTGGPTQAAYLAVATPYGSDPAESALLLRAFLAESLPAIRAEVDRAGAPAQ